MKATEQRSTRYVGKQRIYLHEKPGAKKPYGLAIGSAKVTWFASDAARERIINRIARQNRKGERAYKARVKEGFFVCGCGCGETFQAAFKTRKPKFKNDAHKLAYDCKRREEKRQARMRAKLAEQKERRLAARKADKAAKPEAASADGGTGKGSRGKTRGQGFPLPASTDKGLYADLAQPERSKKRKAAGLPTGGE